ncbi:hypothetical protein M501DRAFT_934227 [Patellaria atrata CBS 101060]|uniref:Uncharacterized protein n=1 Tax=Patellaria atrata CBS 101060 TaxID=1346257 RepID=A0A9P4SB55_9PEZI|nr:hypothetical protein M501DRAFT_934227 [Patellaria atrata CBS 101060]
MSEENVDEPQITFNVKSSSDAKYVITASASSTVSDLKNTLSTSEYADIPVERQRLIYSGRVLKDPDTLAAIKIKDGHTIHLVKGAASNARQNPANQSSSTGASTGASNPATAGVPTNIAAGTGNNPLAALTGARHAGFHGLPGADIFGPDGGMGPPPDADSLLQMMDNPMFLSQMNEAMQNPAIIEMMRNSPMMRNNPVAQQMFDNPEIRRMMTDPQMIRMQLQMQRAMRGQEGSGGGSAFPAPGVTDMTPQQGTATGDGTTATPNQPDTTGSTSPPPNPLASLFGNTGTGAPAGGNPFAALFGTPQNNNTTGTPTNSPPSYASAGVTPTGRTTSPLGQQNQQNPFAGLFGAQQNTNDPIAQMTRQMMQNPEMMRQAMQMLGGGTGAGEQGGANPLTGLFNPFGGETPAAPADNRPPEERYADQLRQLNEMGFYEFERNVQALRRSGGSVQGAVEYLLSG